MVIESKSKVNCGYKSVFLYSGYIKTVLNLLPYNTQKLPLKSSHFCF